MLRARRRRLSAVSTKESTHSDQASRVAVRRLSPPIAPRPCSLAPSVTTPLYSTTVSKALGGVFLGTRGPRGGGDCCGDGVVRGERNLEQRDPCLSALSQRPRGCRGSVSLIGSPWNASAGNRILAHRVCRICLLRLCRYFVHLLRENAMV